MFHVKHRKVEMTNYKNYRRFEGLRIGVLTSFMSGFINAYTFNTQGGIFAGVQSGNVLGMMIQLSKGQFDQAFNYLFPIIFFVFGQFFAYFGRQLAKQKKLSWSFMVSKLMIVLIFLASLISPDVSPYPTIACLAFFASIQLDAFRRVRGMDYANVMMTGNVKNAAALWIKGVTERDTNLKHQSYYTMLVLVSFMIGVLFSSLLSPYFFEYSLYFLLIPLMILNYFLRHEKTA